MIRQFKVTDAGREVANLNELELIHGELWANIWNTYKIARINPRTGKVNSWVDIAGIHPPSIDGGANGIAYNPATKEVLVTGKLWDKMYSIQVIPKPTAGRLSKGPL